MPRQAKAAIRSKREPLPRQGLGTNTPDGEMQSENPAGQKTCWDCHDGDVRRTGSGD